MTRVRFSRICVGCGVRFVRGFETPEPQRYCTERCEAEERQAVVRRPRPSNDDNTHQE